MKNWLWVVLLCISQMMLAQVKITSIKMERTSCFGVCPAYTIEIKSNGACVYQGIKDALYDGRIKGKLSLKEWNALWAKYKPSQLQKLPNSYKVKASDFSKVHYTFMINGKTKVIRNANEGPEYLMALCEDISNLVGKKIKWDKSSFVKNKTQPSPPPPMPSFSEDDVQPIGQVDQIASPDEVYTVVEQMPQFPGGNDAMMSYIRRELRYPETAKELGIQGKVICSFVVDRSGEIRNVEVLRGIGGGCDQEAVRVLRNMPAWTPGKQNGQAVNVKFNLPISFKLD
jgi:TonB family protein